MTALLDSLGGAQQTFALQEAITNREKIAVVYKLSQEDLWNDPYQGKKIIVNTGNKTNGKFYELTIRYGIKPEFTLTEVMKTDSDDEYPFFPVDDWYSPEFDKKTNVERIRIKLLDGLNYLDVVTNGWKPQSEKEFTPFLDYEKDNYHALAWFFREAAYNLNKIDQMKAKEYNNRSKR